jgi:competence protein ComEC
MDLIKRKLEQIDFKLEVGPAYLVRQIIESSPLVLPALAIIIGILLSKYIDFPVLYFIALVIVPALAAFIYLAFKRTASNIYFIVILAFFCSMGLGAIRLYSYRHLPPNDISNIVKERTLATIRGTIITQPYTSDTNDWVFSKYKISDPASSFYLKLSAAEGKNGWTNISGTVRVQINEAVFDLKSGDSVQIYCWLEKFTPATNPGEFDISKKLANENIFIAASVDSRDAIEVLSHQEKLSFFKIHSLLNKAAAYALRGEDNQQDQSKNLIEALILGSRYKIDEKTIAAFRKTGLLHFLSLSGLNFVIMIAFVWWLSKFTGLGKKGQALICIAVSILFVMAVPPNPPVLRAAVISLVFCASYLFSRQPNSFNSLAISAIFLLIIKPVDLFDAGWQLSFATTLGILLFCKRIQLFIYEKIVLFNGALKNNKFFNIMSKYLFNFSGLFSAGLAAWLGGAGIMLYHFNTITPLSSLWTVLASPFVSAITILGLIKISITFFFPSIGYTIGILTSVLSDLLILLVKIFASIDISEILIGQVSTGLIILYYCALFFAAFFFFRKVALRKIICSILILALAISLFTIKFQRTHRSNLVLTCLDVGLGQAILIQPPGTANLLFDAGSLYKSNIGRRIIIPYLRAQAVSKLDAVILSHGEIDHINAIPEVLSSVKTKTVFANESFFSGSKQSGSVKLLNNYISDSGFNIQDINNLQIQSPARIKALWPSRDSNITGTFSENDKSSVSLIDFAGVKILLCSDIEKFAQRKILEIYPDLKVDIIIAPHHGSTSTADPSFIEKLQPQFIIYSSGRVQYENQSTYKEAALQLFTTRDGAIQIKISKSGKITYQTSVK